MGGFKLGRVLGFEIRIDWSWIFIFVLVVYTQAMGYFPSLYKFSVTTNWVIGIVSALLLFGSVLVHELSHSVVARRFGTQVKGITLFLFGGVSQTEEEPKSAVEEFWMAIVGPGMSFALAAVFYILYRVGVHSGYYAPVVAVLGYLAFINLLLGAFNLVPGFPLDGGRVFRSILWGATNDLSKATRWASYFGQGFGYLLIAGGLLNVLTGSVVAGIWFIFIGWFLAGAAKSSYQELLVRQALAGVRVEQVMTTDVPEIPAQMPLRQFVDDYFMRHEYSCYPVMRDDEVIGVVGAEEVRTVPARQWDFVTVGEVAHLVDSAYKIGVNDDAWEALSKLASQDVCRLIVMDNNALKGTVGRDAVFRLIKTKMQMQM